MMINLKLYAIFFSLHHSLFIYKVKKNQKNEVRWLIIYNCRKIKKITYLKLEWWNSSTKSFIKIKSNERDKCSSGRAYYKVGNIFHHFKHISLFSATKSKFVLLKKMFRIHWILFFNSIGNWRQNREQCLQLHFSNF